MILGELVYKQLHMMNQMATMIQINGEGEVYDLINQVENVPPEGRLDENDRVVQNEIVHPPVESVDPALALIRRLLVEGRELGFEGRELQEYVREERREEQAHQEQREERARQERRDDQERDRQFQLDQLKIRTLAQSDQNNNHTAEDRRANDDDFKRKIPFLDDKDDIESWFHQYEHYAHDCRAASVMSGKHRGLFIS